MVLYYDKLNSFIDQNKNGIIEDTIGLISIPSVSNNLEALKKAMDFVISKGREYGFSSYTVLDGRVGIIEMGEGKETLGILVHIDVVDAEEVDKWKFPPFSGQYFDNCIWGRGAMDDKGPVISALYAMRALKNLNMPLHKKVQLIIGTQEEVYWSDMEDYTKTYALPDYGFTPDGEFPMQNREKGYVDVELIFDKKAEKSGEFELETLSGGVNINSIPPNAVAVLKGDMEKAKKLLEEYINQNPDFTANIYPSGNYFEISVEGRAVHSSQPEKGINAISILCKFLNTLNLSKNGGEILVKLITENLADDIYGKSIGLYSEDEYVNGEYMHRTVISPTVANTRENKFHLYLNLRTAYGTTRQDLEVSFSDLCKNYGCTYNILECQEPIYISKDKPFLKTMESAYERIRGQKHIYTLAHGTSYAKAMPNIISAGPVFPGDVDYCHEKDERISLESLINCTKIYAQAIAEITLSANSYR